MSEKFKIAVLISGNGSNLQALIDYPNPHYEIALVLSNRPNAKGLERAQKAKIASEVLDHTLFNSREAFDQAMIQVIDRYSVDAVILAGFMRILTPEFTEHYLGRMLNIHPSLLPKYPGLDTHQKAIEAGDQEHGLSIHFVTSELDSGPIILQARVNIDPEDTAASLQQKVHQKEHQAYPFTVNLLADKQITWQNHQAWYQNQPLTQPLEFDAYQSDPCE